MMKWNNNFVHEQLESKVILKHIKLKGLINHYSFVDENHMKVKYDYYAKLRADEWIKADKKPPFIKKIFGPYFRFLKTYILKIGFLDGKTGWTIAKNEFIMKKKEFIYFAQLSKTNHL